MIMICISFKSNNLCRQHIYFDLFSMFCTSNMYGVVTLYSFVMR